MKKDDLVTTPFGQGHVHSYRETDTTYVIQLPFGTLYAQANSILPPQESKETCQIQAMELNVAYEALEKMRKLNLEVECQERGIPCDDSQCSMCLLSTTTPTNTHKKRFPRIQKLVHQHVSTKIIITSCLSCGSPVCPSHSSQQFRKESIDVCLNCEKLFTLDFVVECMTASSHKARKQCVHHMVDVYDRILLLLKYSEQFIDSVSLKLQETTVVQNKVGIGSSSAGIVSGVLGVAAAATILTPAGPPLLIASLLFGGSATAVQTGTEVKNYYSEANRLADRVLALNGMCNSILKVTSTLRDALLRDYLRQDGVDDYLLHPNSPQHVDLEKHKGTLLAGLTMGRAGAASLELSTLATAAEVGAASRNARFFTRSGTGIMRTARFARFAGGALSAATLLFETKCMSDTIQQIRAGNPCEKAELLQEIRCKIQDYPSTADLDREVQHYLEGLAMRERKMTQEECVRLILDANQLQDYQTDDEESIVFCDSSDTATSTVPSDDADDTVIVPSVATNATTPATQSPTANGISLRERIEKFKSMPEEEYSPKASLIERIRIQKQQREAAGGRVDDSPDSVPVASLG